MEIDGDGVRPSTRAGRAVPELWWPIAGLVIGVWGVLPRYASPPLATSDRVEIADHVVPGLVVIAVSIVVLVALARSPERSTLMFGAGLVIVLAGLWMFATHVPLLAQASRDEVTWGAALYHAASALTVLLFGGAWAATHWKEV